MEALRKEIARRSLSVVIGDGQLRKSEALQDFGPAVPFMRVEERLDLAKIRDPRETLFFYFVVAVNIIAAFLALGMLLYSTKEALVVASFLIFLIFLSWIAWNRLYWYIFGHSIRVGPRQYPQLHNLIRDASKYLSIPEPTVLVFHGHGILEMFLAKRFTRRGVILLTSNLFDALKDKSSSREMMMIIGRQLGHIVAGHYRFWFFKDVVGRFALWFHAAWRRHCHITADRIGLLVAGDLYAAEQALLILTVGENLAAGTNLEEISCQREDLLDSIWSWIALIFQERPYMLERIVKLRQFAEVLRSPQLTTVPGAGALPILHQNLRPLPLMIIHGHDRLSLLELKDFLYSRFPRVQPIVMVEHTSAAVTVPEKFEAIASQVRGAIALLTPDDLVVDESAENYGISRARQNVILEIGWFWARLGRQHFLLLRKGHVEVPSDLSGVEYHEFVQSPSECSERIRDFLLSFDNRD